MTTALSNGFDSVSELTTILHNEPYQFLQPTDVHQHAAVAAAKSILDPLAKDIAQIQLRRRNENRRKRKRGSDEVEDPVLQLRQVFTNGLAVKQVWEQARRILYAAYDEVERGIEEYQERSGMKSTTNGTDLHEVDDEHDLEASEDEEGMSIHDLDESEIEEDLENDEQMFDEEDIEDIEADSDNTPDEEEDGFDAGPQATYKEDPNKLNDGFFSIDDFNKQSQFLEQMDARGDDDNPSDEDEVDWDADPLTRPLASTKSTKKQTRLKEADIDSEEEEEGDGPTFGNADLNAPDSDDDMSQGDVEEGDLDGMMDAFVNTNEVRYADFFEPPPKKPSKSKRTRALPKTQPPKQNAEIDGDEDEAELERAMADVRRDLLDSEDELEEEDDEALSDDSDALPSLSAKLKDKNLSTHEKQKLQIAEEIRRLEAINVSKKPWTLSGEASAGARPLNSLIEEDLDFERSGKPVPVVTAETTTDIEALIKRRILNRDFDELARRRPTTLDSAADARRGRADVVVDDSKATTSLGEIYESEYQRNADPTSYVDKRSAATKKQHDEISKLWKEVREQLDVLANLNIKPKRAEMEVKIVEDKPRIAMEDAQPAVSGGIDDAGTMLAPQEIYKPGTDSRAEKGEVLNTKSGASRSKEEMTREEKLRRRRREKERQKKAGGNQRATDAPDGKKSGKKAEQERILKDLKKGGAKVIGKGGELQEIDPKKKKGDNAPIVSGGALKL